MTPVDPRIGVALAEIAHSLEEIVEPSTPSRGSKCGSGTSIAIAVGILNIEDAHLRIAGAGDQGPIVGVWHKLDGEYIGIMAGRHSRVQCEGSIGGFRLIRVDVQVLIV